MVRAGSVGCCDDDFQTELVVERQPLVFLRSRSCGIVVASPVFAASCTAWGSAGFGNTFGRIEAAFFGIGLVKYS